MNISPQPEDKSLRISYQDDDGKQVFSCGGQYSTRGVYVSFEFLERDWCANHHSDVEEAITDFLGRLNALLEDSNLPDRKSVV